MDSTALNSSQVTGVYDFIKDGIYAVDTTTSYNIQPATIRENWPSNFRLCKKKNGDLVLQGAFKWQRGWSEGGYDWKDLETVNE